MIYLLFEIQLYEELYKTHFNAIPEAYVTWTNASGWWFVASRAKGKRYEYKIKWFLLTLEPDPEDRNWFWFVLDLLPTDELKTRKIN